MSEVQPAVEQPTDPFEIELLKEFPTDAPLIKQIKDQIADIHAKRSYEKDAHEMILRMLRFTKNRPMTYGHFFRRSLWAGIFVILDSNEQICWINQARLQQVTGFTKSSIPRYLAKLKFIVSKEKVKGDELLKNMLKQCKMLEQRKAWTKYDAHEATSERVQYANDCRAYLEGTQDQNALVLVQPAPIMTFQYCGDVIGVATAKQREYQIRSFIEEVEHRVKEEKAIKAVQAEIDAGVKGYDKVEYRINKDFSEEALLRDFKEQLESEEDDENKMQILMDYMFVQLVCGKTKDMRQLFCGCVSGWSDSGIELYWFDLQRMHELTGVDIRSIKQFWEDNFFCSSKTKSATTWNRDKAISEYGLENRTFELYKDKQFRGY